MRILLINVHSFHNAGDFAIALESLDQLYRLFPGCDITISMNDPDSYAKKPEVARERVVPSFFAWFIPLAGRFPSSLVQRYFMAALMLMTSILAATAYRMGRRQSISRIPEPYRSTVSAYMDADLVVSAGGNFIYSRGHKLGLPLLMPLFVIAYASLCGKPIYMLPQTIGPLNRIWERLTVGVLLRKFRLVLVRDPQSFDVVEHLPIGSTPVAETSDLAFLYPAELNESSDDVLCKYELPKDVPLLGITLINWGAQYPPFRGQNQYEQAVAGAAAHFINEYGGHVVLFAQVCGPTAEDDDRRPARRVHRRLQEFGLGEQVHLIDDELDPYVLHRAYGQMDIFLGSRLHSNIFAMTQGVPVIAVAYQDKTFGVMRMLDLEKWTIHIEDAERASFVQLLDALWAERQSMAVQIQFSVAQLQNETHRALEPIREDYLMYMQGWK